MIDRWQEIRTWQQEDSPNRLVIGIAKWIWELMKSDPDKFKKEVREHIKLCYPDYQVKKAKYPDIYLVKNDGRINL